MVKRTAGGDGKGWAVRDYPMHERFVGDFCRRGGLRRTGTPQHDQEGVDVSATRDNGLITTWPAQSDQPGPQCPLGVAVRRGRAEEEIERT